MNQPTDENESDQIERAHYRLLYPESERPELKLPNETYAVIELSERGAHIEIGSNNDFVLGQAITGEIHFKNGQCDPVQAVVLRTEATSVVIGLADGISIKRMLDEQIRIRQKYPQLYRSNE
jgi:hypothetical protein